MSKKKKSPANPKEVADEAAAKVSGEDTSVAEGTEESAKEAEAPTVEVEEPVTEKPAPPAPKKLKPAPAKIEPEDRMAALLKEYKEFCERPVITPSARLALIQRLNTIITFALNHGERKVLDLLFSFFVEENRGVLAEEVVFQSISKMNNTTRMRMELFYSAMIVCVRNKKRKKGKAKMRIDLDRVRDILKDEKIVAFFSSKMR